MKKIIVSACLAGFECRFDGKAKTKAPIQEWLKQGQAIPVCPEELGGLPTPRESSEMIKDENGETKVISKSNKDVTKEFIEGAEKSLKIAKKHQATIAILKSKSPSCGCKKIYDGTFSGNLIDGDGIATALFRKNGFELYTEDEIDEFIKDHKEYK